MKIKTYNIFCEGNNFESTLEKDDILQVSKSLSVILTEDEINWIIWNYDSYYDKDPYGLLKLWDEIIEIMIEDVILPNRDNPGWIKKDIEKYKKYLINKKVSKYNL